MATEQTASIHPLHQPKRPKTPAERAKAYRDRKRAAQTANRLLTEKCATIRHPREQIQKTLPGQICSKNVPPEHIQTVTPVTTVTASRRHPAGIALTVAAFALAAVGVTMNGWFARSLGSTDIAGWLFLGVGVAADLAALAIPSRAARLWQTRQRGTAAVGWVIWSVTFAFAVTAGIGFASINIADVTTARASRTTPAVETAKASLSDAMSARDRECKGGVGRFCREREQAVIDRRQALDAALSGVAHSADPQTEAAIRIVAWLTLGTIKPSVDDFALLRLILLAVLPQVGGMLLMISRCNPKYLEKRK